VVDIKQRIIGLGIFFLIIEINLSVLSVVFILGNEITFSLWLLYFASPFLNIFLINALSLIPMILTYGLIFATRSLRHPQFKNITYFSFLSIIQLFLSISNFYLIYSFTLDANYTDFVLYSFYSSFASFIILIINIFLIFKLPKAIGAYQIKMRYYFQIGYLVGSIFVRTVSISSGSLTVVLITSFIISILGYIVVLFVLEAFLNFYKMEKCGHLGNSNETFLKSTI